MNPIRRLAFVLLTVLTLGLLSTPAAPAGSVGCAALAPAPAVPVGVPVFGAYPNAFTAQCGPTSLRFTSATPACPLTLGPVALPGEYCGDVPGFPSGATITCTGVGANFTKYESLVVGLDFHPWDGNVVGAEPLTYDGMFIAGTHSAKIVNPHSLPARVIAYPVKVFGSGPIVINCA